MIFSLVAMTGLEKCCITYAYLQWLCHSGEWPVARGPLVCNNCCFLQVGGELYFSDIYADRNLSPEARKHEVLWGKIWPICLTSSALQTTIFLANNVDSNETVHYEPSHQDLHHLPFCFHSWMRPVFGTLVLTRCKDGWIHFRNSGMKWLNQLCWKCLMLELYRDWNLSSDILELHMAWTDCNHDHLKSVDLSALFGKTVLLSVLF